jgi:hypothetical protein
VVDIPTETGKIECPAVLLRRNHYNLLKDGRSGLLETQLSSYEYKAEKAQQHIKGEPTGIYFDGYYSFTADTVGGDCGGVYFRQDPKRQIKILGVHGASFKAGVAVATILTREALAAAIDDSLVYTDEEFSAQGAIEFLDDEHSVDMREKCPAGFVFLGTSKRIQHINPNSKLQPSAMQKMGFKSTKLPAKRRRWKAPDGTIVNPPDYFFGKGVQPAFLDSHVADAALFDEHMHVPKPHPKLHSPMLTWEEVLNGVPDTTISPVRHETSAGYRFPWCTGKVPYLKIVETPDGNLITLSDFAKRDLGKREKLLLAGKFPFSVAADTQKDELYPLDKERKFRVVSTDDVADLLLYKKYYGVFIAALRTTHPRGKSQVGINAWGPEFDALAKYLARYGDAIMELDAKAWDFILPYEMRVAFYECAKRYYNLWYPELQPDTIRAMDAIARKYCVHYHIMGHFVYARVGGQFSGLGGTAEENGFCGRLMFKIGHRALTGREDFDECVRSAHYGDDVIASVLSDRDKFNQITFAEWSATHLGMEWTTADKNKPVDEFTSLNQASFISRSFKPFEGTGIYVGALSEKSVQEIPLWVRTTDVAQHTSMMRQAMLASAREMFLHGRAAYEDWLFKMNTVLLRCDAQAISLSYDQLMKEWQDLY